ncbi:glycosyltransferase family 2 protein [Paenibacillus radicibacter]|uniref:glycosyltransferase family 2 protein n=1 Tax=Paenibacillus radicibacter TaxID=2972488 RepID=UPI00358FC571
MHHTAMFDYGILINRGSTDRSVEICKQFAPHWEVRNSRFREFDAYDVDQEVMEIESQISGWKMTLTISEFLVCWDKPAFFSSLYTAGHRMYSIRIIMMIDDPKFGYTDPVYTIPLVKQRHHGILFYEMMPNHGGRFIHNFPQGAYTPGRHTSQNPSFKYPAPAFVLKFFYSPWNDWMRHRKLQFGPTLSARSRTLNLGIQHMFTLEQMEQTFMGFSNITRDLRTFPEYQMLGLT